MKGSKKNKQKGGKLDLPGANTFNFAGENIGSWVSGLGVPVVLVGIRELMKGSKKNKQKGGFSKWGDSEEEKKFNWSSQNGGDWPFKQDETQSLF